MVVKVSLVWIDPDYNHNWQSCMLDCIAQRVRAGWVHTSTFLSTRRSGTEAVYMTFVSAEEDPPTEFLDEKSMQEAGFYQYRPYTGRR